MCKPQYNIKYLSVKFWYGFMNLLANLQNIKITSALIDMLISLAKWQWSVTQMLFGKLNRKYRICWTVEVLLCVSYEEYLMIGDSTISKYVIYLNSVVTDCKEIRQIPVQFPSELFYMGYLMFGSPCWDTSPAHGTEFHLRTCRACTFPDPHQNTHLLQS